MKVLKCLLYNNGINKSSNIKTLKFGKLNRYRVKSSSNKNAVLEQLLGDQAYPGYFSDTDAPFCTPKNKIKQEKKITMNPVSTIESTEVEEATDV